MAAPRSTPTTEDTLISPDEGRRLFEEMAHELLNISGQEFIRRWDAGEFKDIPDIPENADILYLSFLIPLGRQDR